MNASGNSCDMFTPICLIILKTTLVSKSVLVIKRVSSYSETFVCNSFAAINVEQGNAEICVADLLQSICSCCLF